MSVFRFSALFSIVVLFTFAECRSVRQEYLPLVVWHGLGDSAYGEQNRIFVVLERILPGIYIKPLQFGKDEGQDRFYSFFGNANEQVDQACRELSADPKLKNGFNAMGISQGGQLIRGLIQRCSQLRVRNLITLGSQHQGLYGLPLCPGERNILCDRVRVALTSVLYTSYVQNNSIPAQYWRDPVKLDEYKDRNVFLADINNEGPKKNADYVRNLAKVETFVMVRFTKDMVVQPIESSWFGYYKKGQAQEVQKLNETELYKENWLGLQEMDKRGALHFLSVEGAHVEITEPWFIENLLKYLK